MMSKRRSSRTTDWLLLLQALNLNDYMVCVLRYTIKGFYLGICKFAPQEHRGLVCRLEFQQSQFSIFGLTEILR